MKNLGHLLGPVLIEHLIGLIDDGVLDTSHGDEVRLVHESTQAARSGDENVTALAEIVDLLTHWVATVSGAWAKHGLVAHAASLVEDLDSKLAGGNDDDHQRLSTDAVAAMIIAGESVVDLWTMTAELLGLAHQSAQDWDEVGGGLARAYEGVVSDVTWKKVEQGGTYQSERRRQHHVRTAQREWCKPEWQSA